jgi:hypothetical protein
VRILIRIAVVAAILAGFFYLFIRSARDVLAEPYVVDRQQLEGWTLALETPATPTSPILVVRPSQAFGNGLYKQIFSRMMESMSSSTAGGVPVILSGEYELALAGHYSPEALLQAARTAGLESAEFTPVCVSARRVSEPGGTRQVHFVIFNAPAFVAFRTKIGHDSQPSPDAGAFRATSLSPVLIVAATDPNFDRWLPISATAAQDCVAPITVN